MEGKAQSDPKGSNKPNPKSDHGKNSSTSLFLCGLCTFSVVISMYSTYRGDQLEGRVADLESRFANLQSSLVEPSEMLMMRLKREVEEKFHRRMTREAVSTGRRLLTRELEQEQTNGGFAKLMRIKRDMSDCSCPAGE
ncbi:uncharacterized protein LOC143912087 isoform X2 [Arctopsyche grandis]|uniref:uncharacterized protein LOC143912087 isoform X2 n=1 Tax=Arctopsyche grandis TaxID=121162 RepID=UPI00406D914B